MSIESTVTVKRVLESLSSKIARVHSMSNEELEKELYKNRDTTLENYEVVCDE